MYEHNTQEEIFDRMYDKLDDSITALEGTFMGNALQPTAAELAEVYLSLEEILTSSSAVTALNYDDLKNKGADIGLLPLKAYKAIGTITFYGDDDTVVEVGTAVQSDKGLIFYTMDSCTLVNNTADVAIEAEDFGVKYNIPANTITELPSSVVGIVSLTNQNATTGGTEEEDIEHFRQRLLDRVRQPSTGGNKYDYENWSREVAGYAQCIPRFQGRGTVQVLICDSNGLPGDSVLCNKVKEHVEKVMPLGADLTVSPPAGVNVDIHVKITTAESLNEIREAIIQKLTDYLKSLVFNTTVLSYAQVGRIIFEVPGVVDYSELTLNGTIGNITLPEKSVFVLGGVVVE